MRWKIKVFHNILKSGCRAEDARLRTAERPVNLIAIFCILAWRLFWMTMINRAAPTASLRLVLTEDEIDIVDRITATKGSLHQAIATSPAPMIRRPATSLCGEDGRASSTSKSVPA